ncbi:His/Glu/Gln/Arg/opine family amino ABC transporter, permease, 3-TM region [Peptoanaerobacter stomatis]|uniref:ABC transporter, permease protein n=1 Tax=Peptoanaerobacter stomatis TaxID=796937 RepID=J4WDA4_9FIRM|nr:amino acid ABC transporter permease [Peptoanaerobacter stomatis]EHL15346.1 His/Glu/Gln/Arg/opine family amino ABC transporter, permease, 3-TM region [Peptoanaerobacter stomatis]EJU23431.1 ABC transporter, permease protein [Peptoanaerobacter stomatis]NWO24535.1 amino acid ABC transporter permease [Peptostreptococcaceae bacterium oral taxon 081]
MIEMLIKYSGIFLQGTYYTVGLSFVSVLIGTLIGLILALFRLADSKTMNFMVAKILNFIATLYVEVIRGTPLLVQIFLVKLGSYQIFNLDLPDIAIGIIAVSINSGAYVCEVIRSGIQAVDKGQMEAGRSLGMTYKMTMRLVILPQAVKNILPALCNEFVTVIKETSIVSYIGVTDLFYASKSIGSMTYDTLTPLFIIALIYLFITFTLSKLVRLLERRLSQSD